jgi:outer membrane biosynthesis protein TonB
MNEEDATRIANALMATENAQLAMKTVEGQRDLALAQKFVNMINKKRAEAQTPVQEASDVPVAEAPKKAETVKQQVEEPDEEEEFDEEPQPEPEKPKKQAKKEEKKPAPQPEKKEPDVLDDLDDDIELQ